VRVDANRRVARMNSIYCHCHCYYYYHSPLLGNHHSSYHHHCYWDYHFGLDHHRGRHCGCHCCHHCLRCRCRCRCRCHCRSCHCYRRHCLCSGAYAPDHQPHVSGSGSESGSGIQCGDVCVCALGHRQS
jgi:hypothetical protein